MKKRLARKIAKKYGDSWWKVISDTKDSCVYALTPPIKWRTKKILDECHKNHLRKSTLKGDIYYYKVAIYN